MFRRMASETFVPCVYQVRIGVCSAGWLRLSCPAFDSKLFYCQITLPFLIIPFSFSVVSASSAACGGMRSLWLRCSGSIDPPYETWSHTKISLRFKSFSCATTAKSGIFSVASGVLVMICRLPKISSLFNPSRTAARTKAAYIKVQPK